MNKMMNTERKHRTAVRLSQPMNPKRYSTVEDLLLGEGLPVKVVNRFRKLRYRDKSIALAFRNGASVRRLARKHSLPVTGIEDILRCEWLSANAEVSDGGPLTQNTKQANFRSSLD